MQLEPLRCLKLIARHDPMMPDLCARECRILIGHTGQAAAPPGERIRDYAARIGLPLQDYADTETLV